MRKRKQAISILLALALVMFMVQGCGHTPSDPQQTPQQSFITGTYKTLKAAATTYETTYAALSDLYKQELLSVESRDKAIEYGNHFWTAYHSAVDLLFSYAKTMKAEDEAKLNVAVIEVSKLLGVFLEYAGPYLAKK